VEVFRLCSSRNIYRYHHQQQQHQQQHFHPITCNYAKAEHEPICYSTLLNPLRVSDTPAPHPVSARAVKRGCKKQLYFQVFKLIKPKQKVQTLGF